MPTRDEQRHHDEEMLIVHKAGPKAEPKKVGGPPLPRTASLDQQELELMKKQLGTTKDPALRRELVSQIQLKFGNEKAIAIVRETRLTASDDDPGPKPSAAGRTKGKT